MSALFRVIGLACVFVAGGSALAADAHVHGVARLQLVLEGRQLELVLTLPAIDVVGFEHPPVNQKQREALERAADTLRKVEGVFVVTPAAGCGHPQVNVTSDLLSSGLRDAQPHGKAPGAHPAGRDHADIVATYRFECARGEALDAIQTGLFKQFPKVSRLDVQSLMPRGARSARVTRRDARIVLQ